MVCFGTLNIQLKIQKTLTVTQENGPTLFCPPIGHRQERGDYQESWQPMPMDKERLEEAQEMAKKVTDALGGAGIWGVELSRLPPTAASPVKFWPDARDRWGGSGGLWECGVWVWASRVRWTDG